MRNLLSHTAGIHTIGFIMCVSYKGALKMTDMKMTDQIAGHENAGYEIAGHEIARHDKYLFTVVSTNPSNFSSIVENLM